MDGNDGSGDVFRVVNDLVDTRHTLSDIHAGNTCKVESFQCHLSSRLSDTLSCD